MDQSELIALVEERLVGRVVMMPLPYHDSFLVPARVVGIVEGPFARVGKLLHVQALEYQIGCNFQLAWALENLPVLGA